MGTTWHELRRVTSTQVTLGERFGLDAAAREGKRDRSGQIARYITDGLKRDGYAPDDWGKWVRVEGGVE
jgi:hypothetical protein